MKRTIILLACALGIFTANAQSVVESTKFTDNWSVGINAGAITPLTHSAFFKSMRPAFGVGFSKQLTPNFGLGFQGMGYVNTTRSKTAFDVSDVSLLGKVNLMNLFGSYLGTPRVAYIERIDKCSFPAVAFLPSCQVMECCLTSYHIHFAFLSGEGQK